MEDEKILSLYNARDESAIHETAKKYGGLCRHVAMNILHSEPDAEECVSEAYLALWNTIPPKRPEVLSAYAAKLTRNISLNRWREGRAQKRGGGETAAVYDELSEWLSDTHEIDEGLNARELGAVINDFLTRVKPVERRVFLRRYWYFDSVSQIADDMGFTVSKVKSMLSRIRKKLKIRLEKEGYFIEN